MDIVIKATPTHSAADLTNTARDKPHNRIDSAHKYVPHDFPLMTAQQQILQSHRVNSRQQKNSVTSNPKIWEASKYYNVP